MKNSVLYFPYMRVPESPWLTHMLLYWDKIHSIVPYEFLHKPEPLGRYMCELMQEELVQPVVAGQYIGEIPNFEGAFQDYLDGLGSEVDRRRARMNANGASFEIHMEKLGEIGAMLEKRKLAKLTRYPWYDVEPDTADDFMSYLAAVLGQLEPIDSAPMTERGTYLDRFVHAGVKEQEIVRQLQLLRIEALERILPVPDDALAPEALRLFRDQHKNLLPDFRRRIERELVEAAAISDPLLRQRHLDIFIEDAEVRIKEIRAAMHGAGCRTTRKSLKILTAIPGVSHAWGLVGALWDAFFPQTQQPLTYPDFAYAAYAQAELPKK